MAQEAYDLLVIGSGPAGSNAATTAHDQGARVALVERDRLGGTCLNYGCDPTKTLLHTAHLLYQARRAGHYGLRIPSAEADWSAVMAHVKRTIDKFTHVAAEQGRLAARNAFAAEPQPFNNHAIPWVTYTDPELAHAGKTEEQLREEGIAYHTGHKPVEKVERARLIGREEGLIKLLVSEDGTILGGHILAAGAGELIAPVVLAMRAGLKANALSDTILPYPTMAEGVRWAARAALEKGEFEGASPLK